MLEKEEGPPRKLEVKVVRLTKVGAVVVDLTDWIPVESGCARIGRRHRTGADVCGPDQLIGSDIVGLLRKRQSSFIFNVEINVLCLESDMTLSLCLGFVCFVYLSAISMFEGFKHVDLCSYESSCNGHLSQLSFTPAATIFIVVRKLLRTVLLRKTILRCIAISDDGHLA